MNNKRIIELDYLRAISCIMVILYHYTTRYNELYGHKSDYFFNLSFGGWAVTIFFILSGFFALYIVHADSHSFINYISKRAVRLYPPYWVSLIFTTAVCAILMPDLVVSVKDFLINLTMLQELTKSAYVDSAHWTLLRELIFYIIIGLIFKFNLKDKLKLISFIWIIVLIASYFADLYIHNILFSLFKTLIIVQYGQHFIAGITVYYLLTAKNKSERISALFIFALCCAYNYLVFSLGYTLFLICGYLLVLLFVLNSKNGYWTLSEKAEKILSPLAGLAAISYPVYLIHQNFGYAIINLFESNGLTSEFIIIIPIAFSILIGWLINNFVAVPSAKLYNQLIRKR